MSLPSGHSSPKQKHSLPHSLSLSEERIETGGASGQTINGKDRKV